MSTDDGNWSETPGQGVAKVLSASVVDLPQGYYVRLQIESKPPIRLDMEPDGALWLARELLNARNKANGRDAAFPIKTLLMLDGES